MSEKIRVAILDNQAGIFEGYHRRLNQALDIDITVEIHFGNELEIMLLNSLIDVLLLEIMVPTSRENPSPYPILNEIPRLILACPNLYFLVVSMYAQRTLIQAVMEAGCSGYVLKDDRNAIHDLASIVRMVAHGGIYLSPLAIQEAKKSKTSDLGLPLTTRQVEALKLCAAFPQARTAELAGRMLVGDSVFRHLLTGSFIKLDVSTRDAAIQKASQMGLLPA